MEWDDVIYLSLLIFTIVFGDFFRNVHYVSLKKWVSTILGFAIVLLVSGKHTLHPVICVLINSYIIICLNKRYCHIVSLCFTFSYLIFFRTSAYFGIPYAPNHTNLIQMMLTLKVVGLAFEVHDSHQLENKAPGQTKNKVNPDFMDIIHFCFCYIGVLTGPYYSYKTFQDYFGKNYYKYADCRRITLQKLKFVPLFGIVFLLSTNFYPISYVDTAEFHSDRSFWYRLFYIIPVFITFRMRIYIGLILSECACVIAGLGAYPTFCEPKPGNGPTKYLIQLSKLGPTKEDLDSMNFNFNTVKNIDVWYTEFDPSVRSSIRYWNMCVQYWMAFVVYKRFPYKAFRTAATFAVSAIWHGIYAGYFLCLGVVPFYLPIEDIWQDLLRRNAVGTTRKIIDVVFWYVRTQAFSYMGMAFSLLTMERGLRYYGSIYYIYHITSAIALVAGIFLKKFTRKPPKSPLSFLTLGDVDDLKEHGNRNEQLHS